MSRAQSGRPFRTSADLGVTGLVGTCGYLVKDDANQIVLPHTTAGIIELTDQDGEGTGVYVAPPTPTRLAPTVSGVDPVTYSCLWDTGGVAPDEIVDELEVFGHSVITLQIGDTGGHYSTVSDVRSYTTLAAQVPDDDDLQVILDRAERDVDGQLAEPVPWGRQPTGLKLDPTSLEDWRARALNMAVCAQTEYRLAMGEEFFIRAQHASERGPDFAVTGQLPYIGPKVHRELAGTLLIAPTGIGQLAVTTPAAALAAPYWTPSNAD